MASLTPQPRNDSAIVASLGSEAPQKRPARRTLANSYRGTRPARLSATRRRRLSPPRELRRKNAPIRAGCGTRSATRTGRYRARGPPPFLQLRRHHASGWRSASSARPLCIVPASAAWLSGMRRGQAAQSVGSRRLHRLYPVAVFVCPPTTRPKFVRWCLTTI